MVKNNFYLSIRTNYGRAVETNLKRYAMINRKITGEVPKRTYLLRCRKARTIPKHINDRMNSLRLLYPKEHPLNYKINNCINNIARKLLNLEIKISCHNIKLHQREQQNIIQPLKDSSGQNITDNTIEEYIEYQNKFLKKTIRLNNTKLNQKYKKLTQIYLDKLKANFNFGRNQAAFVNLSDIMIPDHVQTILGFGPKFSVTLENEQLPIMNLIADTEQIIYRLSNTRLQNLIRSKIVNVITNKLYTRKIDFVDQVIIQYTKETKQFLKSNPDLYIVSSDKGNKTIVITKEDYNAKALALLSDKETYKNLNSDPTLKYQNKNNALLKKLKSNKSIDDKTYKQLTVTDSIPPRFHIFLKMQKPGIPGRPVVSSPGSPSYSLSKYLANILKTLVNTEYNLQNSSQFKSDIQHLKVNKTHSMVSFDVKSLFTNIPFNLITRILRKKWSIVQPTTTIKLEEFIKLLNFCLVESSYFVFNGKIYQQLDGLPMGNCLASVLADITLDDLMDTVMTDINTSVTYVKKYVDDFFAIIETTMLNTILSKLNNYHKKIQFTMELEVDHSLPFLDIRLTSDQNGEIHTRWYRKEISSGRILNYLSAHPENQKQNTALGFIHRALSLTDDHNDYIMETLTEIIDILHNNNYPYPLIFELVKRYARKTKQQNGNEIKGYASIIYISGVSEILSRIVRKYTDIMVTMRPSQPLRLVYPKIKEKTPFERTSNVVYQIPCTNCPKSYIGQTNRYISVRLNEHEKNIEKIWEHPDRDVAIGESALADHYRNTGHQMDFCQTKILIKEPHYFKRLTLESLHITTNDTINFRTDTRNINCMYSQIIDGIKTTKIKNSKKNIK